MMMKIRIAVVVLATGMSPALAAPIPVALVEEVSGAPAGVEFMDYVETGKTIELGCSRRHRAELLELLRARDD